MPTMMTYNDTAAHSNHGTDTNFESINGDNLLAESFEESPEVRDDYSNRKHIFRNNPSQYSRKELYQQSRSKPSKANQAHYRLPLLDGQKESSPTRQNIMSRNLRSKGPPVHDENYDPHQLTEENPPTMDKIPRVAKGAPTHHQQEPLEPVRKMSKQDEARFQKDEMEKYVLAFRDKDFTKTDLVTKIVGLRKEHYVQARYLQEYKDKNEDLEKNMENLQSENENLVQRLENIQEDHAQDRAELVAKLTKAIADKQQNRSKLSGSILEKNSELKKKIENQAKTRLWGRIKFINSPEDEDNACKLLLKIGDFDKKYVDTKQKRLDMVKTYKTVCKKALFLRRNYATAETKKMIIKRYHSNELVLSLDDLLMCLQRNIQTEGDMEKFMIYWEEYLPKFVGAMEWSEKVRNYVTICRATRKDAPNLPLITPDDEGFGVLCVHNGMARWEKEYKKLKAAANGEKAVENEEDDFQEEKKGGPYDGIFTKTTQGQNFWGGWIPEGLEKFVAYRAMNIDARAKQNNDQLEKDCLRRLRIKVGIEDNCESATEHLKNKELKKRLKKRGRGDEALPPKKKVIQTHIYAGNSSDEEEDNDE